MTQPISKTSEIALGEDFGLVVVKVNGVKVEVSADGSILAYTNGSVQTSSSEIGEKMKDGTIYAGISPDTNKPLYAAPVDAPQSMDLFDAKRYGAKLEVGDKKDFRVPSEAELKVLFNNRAAIGGFNSTGTHPAGYYWSSTPSGANQAVCKRFSDGEHFAKGAWYGQSSVRCVR